MSNDAEKTLDDAMKLKILTSIEQSASEIRARYAYWGSEASSELDFILDSVEKLSKITRDILESK